MSGYLLSTDTNYSVEANAQSILTDESVREVAEKMVHPGHLDVNFLWHVGERTHGARFLQTIWPGRRFRSLSLDVDEFAFFPNPGDIRFDSVESKAFQSFKLALTEVVKHLDPIVGIVDFEADLLCEAPKLNLPLVSWGNYLPWSILNRWRPGDVANLLETVDLAIEIDDVGLLFYIFPLAANQAWTGRHIQIQELYDNNSVLSVLGPDE